VSLTGTEQVPVIFRFRKSKWNRFPN